MLPALITAVGFLLGQSVIQPFPKSSQGICTYTALIANPSTGKSPAMNVVKKSIVKIEIFNNTAPDDSQLTNVGSVEGLLSYLDKIPCMIGKKYFECIIKTKDL